jgi:multiple sugar transport system permease protein
MGIERANPIVGRPHAGRWRTSRRGLRIPRLGLRLPDGWLGFLMVLPGLTLMTLYVLYPLVQVILGSFVQSYTLGQQGHFVGLANFQAVLGDETFRESLGRSLYYTAGNIVLQLVLGLGFALLLNMNLPGRNIARGAVLFPFIVPAVVAALIWTYALDPATGVVNYVLMSSHLISRPLQLLSNPSTAMNTVILISTWKYLPLIVILFLARLQTIPVDVLEAARCDGATALQIFRHVIWPWLVPVVLVAIMARTILSFNEFEMPYLLAHGGPLGTVTTLPVMVRELLNDEVDMGRAAAVSLIMMLILAVVLAGYVLAYRRGERTIEG